MAPRWARTALHRHRPARCHCLDGDNSTPLADMSSLRLNGSKVAKVVRDPGMLVRYTQQRLNQHLSKRRWRRMMRPYQARLHAVLDHTPPVEVAHEGEIELHSLCGRDTVVDAIAMLKSFYRYAPQRFPLVIHEDGTFGSQHFEMLRRHFPGLRVIERATADAEIPPMLGAAGLRLSAVERRRNVMTLKLFDLQFSAEGKRVLCTDTDIFCSNVRTNFSVPWPSPMTSGSIGTMRTLEVAMGGLRLKSRTPLGFPLYPTSTLAYCSSDLGRRRGSLSRPGSACLRAPISMSRACGQSICRRPGRGPCRPNTTFASGMLGPARTGRRAWSESSGAVPSPASTSVVELAFASSFTSDSWMTLQARLGEEKCAPHLSGRPGTLPLPHTRRRAAHDAH